MHQLSIGSDEDIRAVLAVELLQHLGKLRVEEGRRLLEFCGALAVAAASHGQLRWDTAQWPCPRHQHPPCPEIIQSLQMSFRNIHIAAYCNSEAAYVL